VRASGTSLHLRRAQQAAPESVHPAFACARTQQGARSLGGHRHQRPASGQVPRAAHDHSKTVPHSSLSSVTGVVALPAERPRGSRQARRSSSVMASSGLAAYTLRDSSKPPVAVAAQRAQVGTTTQRLSQCLHPAVRIYVPLLHSTTRSTTSTLIIKPAACTCERMDRHSAGCPLHLNAGTRILVQRFAILLQRAVHRRHLRVSARQQRAATRANERCVHMRRAAPPSHRLPRLPVLVLLPSSSRGCVGLVCIQMHLAELGGSAKTQRQHARRQGVQRAGVRQPFPPAATTSPFAARHCSTSPTACPARALRAQAAVTRHAVGMLLYACDSLPPPSGGPAVFMRLVFAVLRARGTLPCAIKAFMSAARSMVRSEVKVQGRARYGCANA